MTRRYDKELSIEELAAVPDDSINYSDIPELNASFWDDAVMQLPENKERLTVRFDADMVKWFRSQGRGYQTRMNAVLRSFFEAHEKH